jgi:hypothetical protein
MQSTSSAWSLVLSVVDPWIKVILQVWNYKKYMALLSEESVMCSEQPCLFLLIVWIGTLICLLVSLVT